MENPVSRRSFLENTSVKKMMDKRHSMDLAPTTSVDQTQASQLERWPAKYHRFRNCPLDPVETKNTSDGWSPLASFEYQRLLTYGSCRSLTSNNARCSMKAFT